MNATQMVLIVHDDLGVSEALAIALETVGARGYPTVGGHSRAIWGERCLVLPPLPYQRSLVSAAAGIEDPVHIERHLVTRAEPKARLLRPDASCLRSQDA